MTESEIHSLFAGMSHKCLTAIVEAMEAQHYAGAQLGTSAQVAAHIQLEKAVKEAKAEHDERQAFLRECGKIK